jgi:hypothetical protein
VLVLSPQKKGKHVFSLVKVIPTAAGHRLETIKEIGSTEHKHLKTACIKVSELISTKDIFGILIDNYNEFVDLLDKIVKQPQTPAANAIKRPILRSAVNTLSSFLVFADHLNGTAKEYLGKKVADQLKKETNKEYDAGLPFRLCSQLRNHATHMGFSSLCVNIRSGTNVADQLQSSTTYLSNGRFTDVLVSIDRDKLLSGKLKSSVRREVENLDDRFEFMGYLREAIKAMERVHIIYAERCLEALSKELELLHETVRGVALNNDEWFILTEPPVSIHGDQSNLYAISTTNYPMKELRNYIP